ncbi:GNAT family N-acetyltransferase [bacterium]|nr:GNAT family N-acetyltransferase [bacterium]
MTQPDIIEQSVADLSDYSTIPIAFEARAILDVEVVDHGLGGFVLSEREIESPHVKDYDAFKGEGPAPWADRWDISNWGILSAFLDGSRVGGCVVAWDTPGVHKLEGRKDVAALWDLRVHPAHRRTGVGSKLFQAAVAWAKERGCRCLKVETQNINVPACRFYARQGCVLGSINRYGYDEFPDEVELVWYKEL